MIIIDNVIKDRQLLEEIKNSTDLFPEGKKLNHDGPVNLLDGSERINSDYFFWEGWHKSEANTLKKRIVESIWKNYLPFPLEDLFGIEYWTRTLIPLQYSEWHVDRGFCYCTNEDTKISKAAIGCVYYPEKDDWEDSFLELRFEKDIVQIPTAPNRVIIFDSANVFHRTSATQQYVRYSMPMNVWNKNSPPTLLEDYSVVYEK